MAVAHKKARGAAAHHRANQQRFAAKSTLPSFDSEIVVDLRALLGKAVNGTRQLRPARAVLFSHFVAERLREVRQ